MIDWTLAAISAVFGGIVVHLAHEWIESRRARRITHDVMGRISRGLVSRDLYRRPEENELAGKQPQCQVPDLWARKSGRGSCRGRRWGESGSNVGNSRASGIGLEPVVIRLREGIFWTIHVR